MSRIESQNIIDVISLAQADPLAFDLYYTEILSDLARQFWNAEASLITATSEAGVYSLPDLAVNILSLFYGGVELVKVKVIEAEILYGKAWKDIVGSPSCYVTEQETAGNFRVIPKPDRTSEDFIFLFGSPLGEDYPEYSIAALHSHRRDLPANSLTEFPVAFEILHREYIRESDHQDIPLAGYFKQLSNLFVRLLK